MSLSVETDLIIGWADEASEGTDPIVAVDSTYNEFGNNSVKFGLPKSSYNWLKNYYSGRQASSYVLKKITHSLENFGSRPTNGLEWYYLLGLSESAAGVHTLTPIAEGQSLPTRVIRYESKGGSSERFVTYLTSKSVMVSETFTFVPKANTSNLNVTLAHKEMKLNGDTGLNQAHNGPALPSSISKEYRKDSAASCLWDGNEVINSLHTIQISGINKLLIDQILNNQEANNIFEGELDFAINIEMYRGHSNLFFQDMYDQKGTNVGKPLIFNIRQVNSTNYKTFTFSDCHIISPDAEVEPKPAPGDLQYPNERFMLMGTLDDIKVKDGVADGFYND